jgi:hypothetical protein
VHGGDGEIHCRVVNLSTIGACAISSHQIPEMAQVRIRVRAPEDGPEEPLSVWCDAAVVRCDRRPDGSWDVGLYFTGLGGDDQRRLAEIIEIHNAVPLSPR